MAPRPQSRAHTFKGLVIAGAGIFVGPQTSPAVFKSAVEIAGGRWATSVSMGVTHLVTTPEHWKRQSPEVMAAFAIPYCNIVSVGWFMTCLRSNAHQSEVPYLLELAFPIRRIPQHRVAPAAPVVRVAPAAPVRQVAPAVPVRVAPAAPMRIAPITPKKNATPPAPVKNILRLDQIPEDDRPFARALGEEVNKLRQQKRQKTLAESKKCVGEMHRAVHSDLEEKAKAHLATGKETAKRDLNSERYHIYCDHTGFYFQEITLTRVDVIHNTNERITLTIYESDFRPHNYITHQNWYAADGSCKPLQLTDGVAYSTAFIIFRMAFRKHTRISWEHRMMSPTYVANEMRKWEQQKREALVFAKVGEQHEASSRSPSPISDTPSKKRKDSVRAEEADIERRARKRQKMDAPKTAEDILTKEELERCLVKPFKYVPPHPGEARGTFPDPRLMGGWIVIPGDEPNDGGFSLPIEYLKR